MSVMPGRLQNNSAASRLLFKTIDMKDHDLSLSWQSEEPCLSANGIWTIVVRAARIKQEDILAYGWTAMHDDTIPTAAICFHCEAAIVWMRTLYSAFAALEDPNAYLSQIGLGWTIGGRPPSCGIVGSAKEFGTMQIYVDWSTPQRHAQFSIFPPDDQPVRVLLGIESVAHIIQMTTEAFKSLSWQIPP
jgi:hypothetical protein